MIVKDMRITLKDMFHNIPDVAKALGEVIISIKNLMVTIALPFVRAFRRLVR